ncbi:uncharacterized membrane protein YcaP (DUF421 family) [Paenibacillus taihuensis]|uniref:Uncharacterized membrane protein YcaP (DUF421 family) n=1 Tax=Paenibacillus taihuensis TaxID=1156355 RepID=A0A3D9RWH2_9BACL|nr:DUF421 domain-containing protein [Paenibacillus taihuensis]REE84330.1 uncharacterized membrane protein YcaP (DUF421 family) [Paenibacillus taihuensis]
MEYMELTFRTLLIYLVVFLIMRMMGKREIGKLSVFDLVISVMIAEIAVFVIEDTDRPVLDGILPMVVLLMVQIGIALISLKNRKMRMFLDGKPTVLVERGKLNREAMRKQRYNLDDLLLQFRENKTNIADVEFAILETTGKLSIIPKDNKARHGAAGDQESHSSSSQSHDTQFPKPFPRNYRFESLPVPLIMDGEIQKTNLEQLGKDRFWLNNQLRQRGIVDAKQVFLLTIDHRGKLFLDARRTRGPHKK